MQSANAYRLILFFFSFVSFSVCLFVCVCVCACALCTICTTLIGKYIAKNKTEWLFSNGCLTTYWLRNENNNVKNLYKDI